MTKNQFKNILKEGWWIQVSPLARKEPTEWLIAIYRKGKTSWITEITKDGFDDPFEAHQWAMNFIYDYKYKKRKKERSGV